MPELVNLLANNEIATLNSVGPALDHCWCRARLPVWDAVPSPYWRPSVPSDDRCGPRSNQISLREKGGAYDTGGLGSRCHTRRFVVPWLAFHAPYVVL